MSKCFWCNKTYKKDKLNKKLLVLCNARNLDLCSLECYNNREAFEKGDYIMIYCVQKDEYVDQEMTCVKTECSHYKVEQDLCICKEKKE